MKKLNLSIYTLCGALLLSGCGMNNTGKGSLIGAGTGTGVGALVGGLIGKEKAQASVRQSAQRSARVPVHSSAVEWTKPKQQPKQSKTHRWKP